MQKTIKELLEHLNIIKDHRQIDLLRSGNYSEYVALVGSRALQVNNPSSDYDYIILNKPGCKQAVIEWLNSKGISFRASEYHGGIHYSDSGDKINLIFLPPFEDVLWVKATKTIKFMMDICPDTAELAKTKEGRILLLQGMIEKFRTARYTGILEREKQRLQEALIADYQTTSKIPFL